MRAGPVASTTQQRIVDLQQKVKIARDALTRIATGQARNPAGVADDALTAIWQLDTKQPLQHLVGHERRPRT